MNNDNLLWKVLRATTNSPNDVWKPRHYERHLGMSNNLLGSYIRRYTVPIMEVCLIRDDVIYLVVQFCTDRLDFPYFVIDKNAFTKNLKADKEFVYAINVRLCFKSEFKIKNEINVVGNGEIKKEYRADVLNDALRLIREKPRSKIMEIMLKTETYKSWTRKELEGIIKNDQFTSTELNYKGNKKISKK